MRRTIASNYVVGAFAFAGILSIVGAAISNGWLILAGALIGCAVSAVAVGIWHAFFGLFLCTAIVRSGQLVGPVLPNVVWYGLIAVGLCGALAVVVLKDRPAAPALPKAKQLVIGGMLAFVLASGISTVFSPNRGASAKVLAPLAAFFVWLIVHYIWRWTDRQVVRRDLCFAAYIVAASSLIGVIGFWSRLLWSTSGYGRMAGLTQNANYAGQLAAVAIVILTCYLTKPANRLQGIAQIGLFAVLIAAIFGSGSRGAVITALVGVTVALWWRPTRIEMRTRLVTQTALLLLAVVSFIPPVASALTPQFPPLSVQPIPSATDTNSTSTGGFDRVSLNEDITSGRMDIYKELLQRFSKHPFSGSGFGTTPLYNSEGLQGHNLYLQVLAETGLIGFISLGALLVLLLRAGGFPRPQPLIGALVAVLVFELTETSVFGWMSPTALFCWLPIMGFGVPGEAEDEVSLVATEAQ